MDPELKAYLDEMRSQMATKADLDEMRHDLDALKSGQQHLGAQGRELRQGQADIIQRLDEGFAARKEDEDLALREIRAVKRRVTSLERRVKLLEAPQR